MKALAKQDIQLRSGQTLIAQLMAAGEFHMGMALAHRIERMKEQGAPVEVVYATEGTPLITAPSGVFKNAPNPNAARLFYGWLHGIEAQQLLVDFARQHSVHAQAKEKPGRRKLSEIKLMKDDPAGVEKAAEEIKARYAKIFKV